MKKWILLCILVGGFWHFNPFKEGRASSMDKGIERFHKEIKHLFKEEKYAKVIGELQQRLSTALPPHLTGQYKQLLSLAEKLSLQKSQNKKLTNPFPLDKTKTQKELMSTESKGILSNPINKKFYQKWKSYLASHPNVPSQKILKLIPLARKKGDLDTLRYGLSILYTREKNRQKKDKLRKELDQLNKKLLFSSTKSSATRTYIVKSGDFLYKIYKKTNCPVKLIMKINNISNPQKIFVGQKLKVLAGKRTVLVTKRNYILTIYLNGFYLKQYKVGLGKNNCTPTGTFIIRTKQVKPSWYWKNRKYKYGHPKNILGTRWLGFKNTKQNSGYGIHGTSKPETIGKQDSSGCVRMRNREVEELYDMIPRGTKVTIIE